MTDERFHEITGRYPRLRIAVVGDFCLDRYLEIDPAKSETSIETGLPVHNVVRVRSQPGAAGTILNNLVALGVGEIHAIGFCGEDGEGYELKRALTTMRGVRTDHFLQTPLRRTFTYCKPLVMHPDRAPEELSRLDSKNWEPTPEEVSQTIATSVRSMAESVDAIIVLDQVDVPETGVITTPVLDAIRSVGASFPALPVLADRRRGLNGYPPLIFKMNATELAVMMERDAGSDLAELRVNATQLAKRNGRPVFVTLSERGILAAEPEGRSHHVPCLPVRGEIDIVGAGDAVTANLAAALAARSDSREAILLGNAAGSVVVHQLGTTGTATVAQLREALGARDTEPRQG